MSDQEFDEQGLAESDEIRPFEHLTWHMFVLATRILELQNEIDQANRYLHALLISIGAVAGIVLAALGAIIVAILW